MRGAAFLVQNEVDEAVMVVDIGGTTTDVGLLLANGFPRQQAAYSDLAGGEQFSELFSSRFSNS